MKNHWAGRLAQAGVMLAAVAVAAGCDSEVAEEEPVIRPVRAMKIGDPSALEGSSYPGRAKALLEVAVSFEVTGRLVELPIRVGDRVTEGQVLGRLDPRDFENALAAAEAERERAGAQLERVQQAAETGAVSQQDLTDATAAFNVADAEVRIRRKALDDTVVRSPFNGNIAAKYVENFDNVIAKQEIARLLDTSKIEMIVNIPETQISLVRFVEEAWVRFDAFPDEVIPATVKEIGTEASETTRTFPVKLIMDQPEDIEILPGMSGRAGAANTNLEGLDFEFVDVPLSAVFTDGLNGQSYVWTIDEQSETVHLREVKVGRLTNVGVQIDEGLEPGEWIAVAGVHFLQEGQQVRIQEEQPEELTR